MQSSAVFMERPDRVCIVYPWTSEEVCSSCGSNEWSHRRPGREFGRSAQLPLQLVERVPLDVWKRILDDCYSATQLDFSYYKYLFGPLLLLGLLMLLVLAPTIGLQYGGPICIGIFVLMVLIQRLLAKRVNHKLAQLVKRHRPALAMAGCSIEWRSAWIGGCEALSRYVWLEVTVLAEPEEEYNPSEAAALVSASAPGAPRRIACGDPIVGATHTRVAILRADEPEEGRGMWSGSPFARQGTQIVPMEPT